MKLKVEFTMVVHRDGNEIPTHVSCTVQTTDEIENWHLIGPALYEVVQLAECEVAKRQAQGSTKQ